MRRRPSLVVAFASMMAAMGLSGCVTEYGEWRWEHPEKSPTSWVSDEEACSRRAKGSSPSNRDLEEADSVLDLLVMRAKSVESSQEEEELRAQRFWNCMQKRGYERQWYGDGACDREPDRWCVLAPIQGL